MRTFKSMICLMSICLILSCTNEAKTPVEGEKSLSISQIELNNKLLNSLISAENLSHEIIEKYKDQSNKNNDLQLSDIILNEKANIIQRIQNEFPEFVYDASIEDDEITILLDNTNLSTEIEDTSMTIQEKNFLKTMNSLIDQENFTAVKNLIDSFKANLNNNNFNAEQLERANYMGTTFSAIYNTYNTGSNATARGWKSILKSALAGAMVGAVRGFIKGCITGAFLGFNPGSVAAGCMGGMVVGMVTGAVAGTIGGAIADGIIN